MIFPPPKIKTIDSNQKAMLREFEDPNPLEPREVAGVDAVGTQILQVLDSPEQVSEVIPEQPEFPPDALPEQFEAPLRGYS